MQKWSKKEHKEIGTSMKSQTRTQKNNNKYDTDLGFVQNSSQLSQMEPLFCC